METDRRPSPRRIMNYEMTSPCANCPFRTDPPFHGLSPERVDTMVGENVQFSCHNTRDYKDSFEGKENGGTQHCAGSLIMQEKEERPSQMMRISERLGYYDRTKLNMDAPVYDSREDMKDAFEELSG